MSPPDAASAALLVVDDDVVHADTLARALTLAGHPARAVYDGEAALSVLRDATACTGIILDLRLGTVSSLPLIAPMRSLAPHTPILLLTGYASIATAVEAIKLGATQYLAKPAGVREILAALGREEGDADTPLPDTPLSVDRLEWEHIQKVLAAHDGNLSATARALKMHRRTLQRKLAKRPVKA